MYRVPVMRCGYAWSQRSASAPSQNAGSRSILLDLASTITGSSPMAGHKNEVPY
jgi:hypothetical protein